MLTAADNIVEAVFAAIGLVVLVGLCGAAWTFGCAIAARCMKWAPINFNVTTTSRD